MKNVCYTALILMCLITIAENSNAEDEPFFSDNKWLKGAGTFLLCESTIAINSGLAAQAPPVFGAFGLLFSPLGLTGESWIVDLTSISMFAGICTYNLTIPANQNLSKKEIFTHNMIGWHIFALGVFTVGHFTDSTNPESDKNYALSFLPDLEKPMINISVSF